MLNIVRSIPDEEIPYRSLEKIKDGRIISTKYEGHIVQMP